MQYKIFSFNPLQVNTTVVWDDTKCLLFDPACSNDNEYKLLNIFFNDNNISDVEILLTHAHFDHIMGVNNIVSHYGSSLRMHEGDTFLLENAVSMAGRFGIPMQAINSPDEYIDETYTTCIGGDNMQTLHVPGHSPGSLCYFFPQNGILISGDVLFNGSIGRTDLPGGSMNLLTSSIKSKLLSLPEDTCVICGHGQPTTIGKEKRDNPFLQ